MILLTKYVIIFFRFGIVVQILFALAIFVSYGLNFYVPMSVIGPWLEKTRFAYICGPKIPDYLVRAALVILTCEYSLFCYNGNKSEWSLSLLLFNLLTQQHIAS